MEQCNYFTNDYFSNLINEITDHTNKLILNADKSEIQQIYNLKHLLILNIDKIQIPDINKNIVKTGFFIPNQNLKARTYKINFANQIGKLIILGDQLDSDTIQNLRYLKLIFCLSNNIYLSIKKNFHRKLSLRKLRFQNI